MPDARRFAFDLIDGVLAASRPLDEAFADHADGAALASRDRAFARLIAATVLRRLGQIDAVIDRFVTRPPRGKGARIRSVLRVGLAQLLFLETPAHAAVSTTVTLARAAGLAGFSGLVNAVMRRTAAEAPGIVAGQDAAALNAPAWLLESWQDSYGADTARAIAAAHLTEPPLDLTVKSDPERWAATLAGTALPTGSVRLAQAGDVTALEGFTAGEWWVQDAAAALPARLLGEIAGRRVVDLCAATGGKTAQLVQAGAHVTAVDRSGPRLGRLQQNLDRLGMTAEVVTADAADWRPAEPADAVLLDAPCSATGTIRRHPDIAHLKTAADVTRLAGVQARLLAAAAGMLAPGGRLVYATCSLQAEEGEHGLAAFLAGNESLRPDPVRGDELPALESAIRPDGNVRTLPSTWGPRGGMDGFFIARLTRA